MAAQFQLVMRSGPTAGKAYPLETPEVSIGRDTSNTISINDGEVSRKHAKMTLQGSAYVMQDLGSTNGTFVNGTRLSGPVALKPGDTVSFGETIVLMYEAAYDPNATMVSGAKASKTSAPLPKPEPAPAPAYAGQVPAAPAPTPTTPKKKGGSSRLVIIILVVVVLCLILACVGALLWIDADKTGARWCAYLPFIAKMLGAVCQ
jgi:predicted component of type VI protein secretion system